MSPGRRGRGGPAHPGRSRAGHARLHESRAGEWCRPAGRAERRLQSRVRAVRDARRRAALHRAHGAGGHREAVRRHGPIATRRAVARCQRSWSASCCARWRRRPRTVFRPRARFAAALRAGEPWTRRAHVTAESRRGVPPSVAVLPFANRSPSPDDEYFADGMTDELINALAKVPGLHVVVPHLLLRLQGTLRGRARDRAPPPGGDGARGQHPPGGAAAPGRHPAHQRRGWIPALVRELRPGGGGRLRDPGRDRPGDQQRAARPSAGPPGRGAGQASDTTTSRPTSCTSRAANPGTVAPSRTSRMRGVPSSRR